MWSCSSFERWRSFFCSCVGAHNTTTYLQTSPWTRIGNNEVTNFIDDLGRHLYDENVDNPEERRELLRRDVRLVAEHCPNLRRMTINMTGDLPYLRHATPDLWAPLAQLHNLRDISVMSNEWPECVSLVNAMGDRLHRLSLKLDGGGNMTGSMWNNNNNDGPDNSDFVPKLDAILDMCPDLEVLNFSFGMRRAIVSAECKARASATVFPKLRALTVRTVLAKDALVLLWSCCPNLEHLSASALADGGSGAGANADFGASATAEFDVVEVRRLLRSNRMCQLRHLNVPLVLADMESARTLIDALPGVSELGKLIVKVGLPQEDYASHEEMLLALAHVMQSMRHFKVFCSSRPAQKVEWEWQRLGFLESFAEIEQLNALIEPNM